MLDDEILFELDSDGREEMTDTELAFIDGLRAATAHLNRQELDDIVYPSADEPELNALIAGLEVSDPDAPVTILDFGVHVRGDRLDGGRLHNQSFHLNGLTPSLTMTATGTVEELVRRTADYFESVLRRPLVLYMWLHKGQVYASSYAFADTSEVLSERYNSDLEPPGLTQQVDSAEPRRHGWVETSKLPSPDLFQHLRGDLAAARIPDVIRQVTERPTM
jgi:hypothetical protein